MISSARKIVYFLYKINYQLFLKRKLKRYRVLSIEETIDKIKNDHKSISRFGDGEFSYIFQKNKAIKFEKNSDELSNELKRVLTNESNDVLIGLPDQFRGLGTFTKALDGFYVYIFNKFSRLNTNIFQYLSTTRTYYNTEFTRIYADYLNKEKSAYLFKKIQEIWEDKDILIVEGSLTRFGVGNELVANAKSIDRIECPSENAFEKYSQIKKEVLRFLETNNSKDYIVLIALGPTATVLAYDLGITGQQAIDIGHLDLEYEWFVNQAEGKINIPDRYINEVDGGTDDIQNIDDSGYESEIKIIIK